MKCSLLFLAALFICSAAAAEQYEDYEYSILDDGTAEITNYSGSQQEVIIPSVMDGHSVTSIGEDAFDYCSSLTSVTIPDSVISIGNYAFYNCGSLTSVTIPAGLTSIGKGAFSGCLSLAEIAISPDHPVFSVTDGVLVNKTTNALILYAPGKSEESYEIPNGVTAIGELAFSGSSLTSVTIPNSVTSIGNNAFYDCLSLTEISISPDHPVFSVADGVLFDKTTNTLIFYAPGKSENSYVIPDGVTSIGNYAFRGCSSLTSVTIPNSVISIGDYAFSGIRNLASVTIPNNVTSIGDSAFSYCSSLASFTIPNSVTSIGKYAFRGNSSLTSVTIPDSVTSIGDYAFYNCSSLTSVTIPDSVTSIGKGAFFGNELLVLTVKPESYAEKYAAENQINFTYSDN